jgi:Inner membrane protein YgaP-like, transmembrane domain
MNSKTETPAGCARPSWNERMVRRVAGTFVLVSLVLGWKVHPGWFGFTAFVGVNLLQSSFTGFCPLDYILRRFDPERRSMRTNPVAR